MRKSHSVRLLALICALFLSQAARADLYLALQAIENKDYPRAFELFGDLAKLGNLRAQENLAVMYVSGEGVKRDNIMGYAWATIALENGGGEAMKSIVDQLDPHMTPSARKKVDEVYAKYGLPTLRKTLLPRIFNNANYTDREPCRLTKGVGGPYPMHAKERGIQGNVYVEFTVMPDGKARNPRVVYSVPAGVFDDSAREGVLRSEFSPARGKTGLVPCQYGVMFRYEMREYETEDYPKLDKLIDTTRAKAEAGDPHSQMMYGLLLSGLPQLNKPRSEAMPWFLKAAQAGVASAQYTVGFSILRGWGCECDEPMGTVWLHKAAAADQTQAQVALANYLLRGDPKPEDVAAARTWLERAVANGNRDAKFYLAAVLASAPDAASRDPQRALAMLGDVMRDVDNDPTSFEIRAAAKATLGKFPEALKDQQKALRMAKKLGWETASQETRLKSYQANTAWTGDLFAF